MYVGGDLVLGLKGKIFNFGGNVEKCAFKTLCFRLVPFKSFQCLSK